MKRIMFYAVKEDLLTILEQVELTGSLRYFKMGNSLSSSVESYLLGKDIPHLGIADRDSGAVCTGYLLTDGAARATVRRVDAQDGQIRYCIDQLHNPDSVVFRPAGVWNDLVLSGQVGTASNSKPSQRIMTRFSRAFEDNCVRIGAYRIGRIARKLLEEGTRLTISAQSSSEFDLQWSPE